MPIFEFNFTFQSLAYHRFVVTYFSNRLPGIDRTTSNTLTPYKPSYEFDQKFLSIFSPFGSTNGGADKNAKKKSGMCRKSTV